MLSIVERNNEELTTLNHGKDVFHKALELVKEGEFRFHVTDEKGKVPDYDLEYAENMSLFPEQVRAVIKRMTNGGSVYGQYLCYDEEDTDNMCLNFFKLFDKIELECNVDEYSVGFIRAALKYTDIPVYYIDDRYLWFFEASDRFIKADSFTMEKPATTLRVTGNVVDLGYSIRDFSKLASVAAFQNVFFWQGFTRGNKGPFKYLEMVSTQIAGIGGVLSGISCMSRVGGQRGLKAFVKPGSTRYPEELLCKYFRINPKPEDATEANTITIDNVAAFTTTWFYCQFPANFDESILDDKFAEEMREYADAIIGGRKTLGVLARGTDYLTANLGADRTHATTDQMITVIKKWVEEDGYEKIFLATEDQDHFDKIKAAFPGKVIAISQERTTAREMKKKGVTLIYEFEKKSNEGQSYSDALEDTTVNYFYALYILSKCDAFLCSGQCNGWDSVRALRGDKFERERKLFVSKEGDPLVEDWKEVRPITAGMFARGAYPTAKAFFATYRFDLKEKVDIEALKKAWDKTLSVYPYLGYAVATRNARLVLLENPLPFVFKETSEVVEPFGRSGNFHTVTFCYLENALWIYVDQIPFDTTGINTVFETLFYHYYCETDQKNYDVPEGVHTEKDGVLEGQEVDAYGMVDAIDPKVMMGAVSREPVFSPVEGKREELFLRREDCRAYCISVPGDEFISYTKSVNGSPMSQLNILFARAMERVHPENKLPIKLLSPISVRKVMGNENSLLHQVVHSPYTFKAEDLLKGDAELNAAYSAYLGGFASEQNIRMMSGIYRGICEGYMKAFMTGALDTIILDTLAKTVDMTLMVNYIGTLRTAEYGDRIRMSASHVMPGKGVTIQVSEVGGRLYIDWYQGFHGDMYAKAMRDIMRESGMKGTCLERVE